MKRALVIFAVFGVVTPVTLFALTIALDSVMAAFAGVLILYAAGWIGAQIGPLLADLEEDR